MSLTKRQLIECELANLSNKTGIRHIVLARYAGVSERTWREWLRRKGQETRHNGKIPREHWLTPNEERAICEHCRGHLELGYRVLCWEMVDLNIAMVSPSSVYNVLKRHGLTKKWAKPIEERKKGFDQPKLVHEQWHIDFSYIRISNVFYYFISILDGYSRKILVWDLCQNMGRLNAEILLTRARELYPEAKARIISDNGSQFISEDFRELVKLLEFEQTFISAGHPQSNGKLERWHRTFKSEHVRQTAYLGYEDAKERMDYWIEYYNHKRLHSAICYLSPDDVFEGRKEKRLAERKEKLRIAYSNRQSYWQLNLPFFEPPYKLSSKTASSA
jgi:transposase InsO family protein